jgi:hypothetical protein
MDRCENDLEMQADFLRSYCKNSLNSDEGIRPLFPKCLKDNNFIFTFLLFMPEHFFVTKQTFFCDGSDIFCDGADSEV